MTAGLTLVQLSDAHYGADWDLGHTPPQSFRAAVESARTYEPDAVIVTGDLTEAAEPDDYAAISETLDQFDCPVFVLPGNHDDRAAMRGAFGVPGEGSDPIQYTADIGPVRLICADTLVPGTDGGDLDDVRLEWIADALIEAEERPVIFALHHPPILSGIEAMDEMAPPASARRRLGELLASHGDVLSVIGGHVHRPIASMLGSTLVFVAPSTYGQLRLRLGDGPLEFDPDEAPGYGLHLFDGGALTSHTVSLPPLHSPASPDSSAG